MVCAREESATARASAGDGRTRWLTCAHPRPQRRTGAGNRCDEHENDNRNRRPATAITIASGVRPDDKTDPRARRSLVRQTRQMAHARPNATATAIIPVSSKINIMAAGGKRQPQCAERRQGSPQAALDVDQRNDQMRGDPHRERSGAVMLRTARRSGRPRKASSKPTATAQSTATVECRRRGRRAGRR